MLRGMKLPDIMYEHFRLDDVSHVNRAVIADLGDVFNAGRSWLARSRTFGQRAG